MTKFKVVAQAISRNTRKAIGKPRSETINTKTNSLFRNITTPLGVERKVEAFWNDVNPHSREIVKVIGVKRLKK